MNCPEHFSSMILEEGFRAGMNSWAHERGSGSFLLELGRSGVLAS